MKELEEIEKKLKKKKSKSIKDVFKEIKNIGVYALLIIAGIVLVVLSWMAERYINYSLSYEQKTRNIVVEMVKTEALK
jgi:predicted ferric reductase